MGMPESKGAKKKEIPSPFPAWTSIAFMMKEKWVAKSVRRPLVASHRRTGLEYEARPVLSVRLPMAWFLVSWIPSDWKASPWKVMSSVVFLKLVKLKKSGLTFVDSKRKRMILRRRERAIVDWNLERDLERDSEIQERKF